MPPRCVKILLTGSPGCGKTTAIMKIVSALDPREIVGFYTQEIRRNGARKGFSWNRLDGAAGTLAHVDVRGCFKVGKYGVDVDGFERAVVPILGAERTGAELFIVDEIGKMECLSEKFVGAVRRLFASDRSVLATVARKGTGLIREVKDYPSIRLFKLTHENQPETIAEILQIFSVLKRPS
jgi:nucleoside-triphosphatase